MRRMANSRWPEYTVIIGSTLTVAAIALTFILIAFERSARDVSSILIFEYPVAFLVAVLGVVIVLIGVVCWASRLSSQTLAVIGAILVSLAVVFYLGVDQVTFGFDDETLPLALLIVLAPGLVGVVCLLCASARRERASR
jgi:uncharacterized membrane protein